MGETIPSQVSVSWALRLPINYKIYQQWQMITKIPHYKKNVKRLTLAIS